MSDYRLAERVPSVEDYNRVRVAAGLSEKYAEAAIVGLANTVCGVCVENRGEVVGIGRVIGDEGLSGFYERYGFRVRPPEAPGMSLKIGREAQSL
jgi:hypothetical protein